MSLFSSDTPLRHVKITDIDEFRTVLGEAMCAYNSMLFTQCFAPALKRSESEMLVPPPAPKKQIKRQPSFHPGGPLVISFAIIEND